MCVVILNIFNRYYTILYYSRVATLRSRYRLLSFSRLDSCSRRSAKYVPPGALGCSVQADRRVRSPRG